MQVYDESKYIKGWSGERYNSTEASQWLLDVKKFWEVATIAKCS